MPEIQTVRTVPSRSHHRLTHSHYNRVDSILGTAKPSIQQTAETVRAISRTSYKRPTGECSTFTTNGRALDTTEQQPTLPLGEHARWTSIYTTQTKHARRRFRDMATDPCQVLHTSYCNKHWVLYTATKTTTGCWMNRCSKRASQHARSNSPSMNKLTRQQRTTTRCSQDCNAAQ